MKKGFFVLALSLLLVLSSITGIALGQYAYGSKVAWSDHDYGRFLTALPMGGLGTFFDVDASLAYNAIDPVYLDAFPIADRLTPFDGVGGAPGHQVVFASPDYGMPYLPLTAPAIVYLPIYGSPAYNPLDPIYLVADTTLPGAILRTNDVRLSAGNPAGAAGSKVTDFSIDNGKTYTPMPGTLQYVDTDGSGSYTIGDKIYLHLSGATFVDAGDLRLTAVP
jgi:hypothetical protein